MRLCDVMKQPEPLRGILLARWLRAKKAQIEAELYEQEKIIRRSHLSVVS